MHTDVIDILSVQRYMQTFSAYLEHLSKRINRQVVTKQMLLNSKQKLVLHNVSVVRFAFSFFACKQCSKWGEKGSDGTAKLRPESLRVVF